MITVCPSNHFGPSCAKCPQKCRSCDSITGVCIQCQESYYGEFCHLNCPVNCPNLTCDQQTGSCNGCKERFEGKSCELEMASLSISTGFSIFCYIYYQFSLFVSLIIFWCIYIYSIVVAGKTRVLFDETCDKSTLIDKEGSFAHKK